MTTRVLYDFADNVATLTLNRPDRMNALTPTLFKEWQAATDRALDDGARAIVLTGAGKAFSTGADLQGGDGPEDALGRDLSNPLETYYNPMIRRLADLPVPVVSAINGPAVGAGMGFALSADIAVMARSAYLMLAFVRIGLVPDAGSTWLVAKAVGRAKALELALLGDEIPAEEGLRLGLVNRVVDDEDVLPTAQALAKRLAQGPSQALGMIRKQVANALDADFDAVLADEAANQAKAGATEDFMEAVMAFREKRPPAFKGR
ncbi:enoyl-CoA hydratase-related protein [Aurantiacibacter gangjinensis]|uniref:Enoyl-CoA hydratase n=1 Tax=Aurantiacibacter gangjinensis TaxID=502682 RepID=A0A0G9MQP9_9SPHN|nr:enoyl-CoA hydratase-related protein [Aurantiacibacter gangjinensis]APE28939.1 Enoyl-CoA hydratase [Aurantiacibacter gangjinensis]KLE33062.1 enoyl-CoA hydratase [Aurantiacibacter gangjinensis]